MLGNYQGPDAPLIDPELQAALDRGRQQMLAQQLAGQQQQPGIAHNPGEGLQVIGINVANLMKAYGANKAATANATTLANILGGGTPYKSVFPQAGMAPMATAPGAGPPLADALSGNVGAGLAGIAKVESGGNYGAVNKESGATGKYQFTQGFLDHYGPGAGYPGATLSSIKGDPQAQEAIAAHAYSQMLNKGDYPGGQFPNAVGDPSLVAHGWLSGHPGGNPSDKYTHITANDYAARATANLSPSSYGVPKGQTAGPAVPSDLPASPVKRLVQPVSTAVVPGFRDNQGTGIGGSIGTAPDPSEQVASRPNTPLPQQFEPLAPTAVPSNPMLSPNPIGPPQSFQDGPPAAAAVAPPPPAAVQPPVPAAPVPVAGAGGAPPGTHYARLPGPPLLLADNADAVTAGGPGNTLGRMLGSPAGAPAPPIAAPQAALANGLAPGTVPAPARAPAAQPMPPQGPPAGVQPTAATALPQIQPQYQAEFNALQVQHDTAVAQVQLLQRKAQLAIAASGGNPQIASFFEKQISDAIADAKGARDRATALLGMPTPERPLTAQEASAHNLTPERAREFQYNPNTGALVPIPQGPAVRVPLPAEVAQAEGMKDTSGYQYNTQTHEIEQIKGTEGGATEINAEDIQKHPFLGLPENQGLWMKDKNDKFIYIGPKTGEMGGPEKNTVLGQGAELINRGTGEVIHKNQPSTSLTDEAIDQMAERASQGDQSVFVGLGRGAQGAENISKIRNRMAEMGSSQDQIDNVVELAGRKATARTVGGIVGKLDVYGESAYNAANLAMDQSDKVPRSNFVPLNKLMMYAESQISDPKVRGFYALNNTMINEYAKATTPTGQPTDSQRNHAEALLQMADSPETYKTVAKMLQLEIRNTQAAGQNVAGKLRKGTGGEPPTPLPTLPGAPAPGAEAPQPKVRTYNPETGKFE